MPTPASPFDIAAFWTCIVIATASSSISITITQTELSLPIRTWSQRLGHMIGYLFQCFYCMKHWIVAALILIYQPVLLNSGFHVVDLAVSWFFSITLSTFISGLMFKVFLLGMAKKVKENELKALFSAQQES